MGGAQAIAGFAYGFDGCPKVNLITGPGNIYVVAAKRLLQGRGRDRLRGRPDRDRDPRRRHRGPGARRRGPDQPGRARPDGRQRAGHAERDAGRRGGRRAAGAGRRDQAPASGSPRPSAGSSRPIVLVDDLEQGTEVVDAYAAEHLEIQTADAEERAGGSPTPARSSSARWSPVSLGDYCAGSNHVLPTAGCACHSSGLSVRSFLKAMHVVDYSREALAGGRRSRASRWRTPRTCRRTAPR